MSELAQEQAMIEEISALIQPEKAEEVEDTQPQSPEIEAGIAAPTNGKAVA